MTVPAPDCQGGLRQDARGAIAYLMAKSDDERAKRLAEALRHNLRRRKAQSRGDAPAPDAPAAEMPPGEHD